VLHGEKVVLRARHDGDVQILLDELHNDVATRSRSHTRPWRPISPGTPASPYAVTDPDEDTARFSVVESVSDELAGDALLWDIDTHNRFAHIGISLRPAFRGRGLALDTVRVLCRYGFAIRGLRRLQIETLADNAAMLRTAANAGFVREGVLRKAAWVNGGFIDDVILGLLVEDWNESTRSTGGGNPVPHRP
jgi:RimJ/RimL family protein N-acetyltransferase